MRRLALVSLSVLLAGLLSIGVFVQPATPQNLPPNEREVKSTPAKAGATDVWALDFRFKDPRIIIGLFLGGLLPYLFSAFSMNAVGRAAGAVVTEVRRQLAAKPGILRGEDTPEYGACVDIVTKAALREMIALLGEKAGLSHAEAYMLCSLAGDLHITQTVNGNKGVHMMMEKKNFAR